MSLLTYEAWPGTFGTVAHTPDRQPSSVRRSTSIQSIWPDGFEDDRFTAIARGQDVFSDSERVGSLLTAFAVDVAAEGPRRTVRSITADPHVDGMRALVGAHLAGGFRKAAATAIPELPGSLLGLLLDDVPAAVLVAGQVPIRAGIEVTGELPDWIHGEHGFPVVCIGRLPDGVMEQRRRAGAPLLGQGPPAGDLRRDDDPWAWPDAPPMPIRSMRRLRRTDVRIADEIVVDSHFRDSYMEQTGIETAVHEYEVFLTASADDGVIRELEVRARVLPGPDCPGAVASAQRVIGAPLERLREFVRAEMQDDTICTHLNDQLRSLADVPFLARELRARI